MMRIVSLAVALLGAVVFCWYVSTSTDPDQKPVAPSLQSALSDRELRTQKDLARKGDCDAALKVHRHYIDVILDSDQALSWLRIAARCPSANAKAELVYLLLPPYGTSKEAGEIDQLVLDLERIDPAVAKKVKEEVARQRATQ